MKREQVDAMLREINLQQNNATGCLMTPAVVTSVLNAVVNLLDVINLQQQLINELTNAYVPNVSDKVVTGLAHIVQPGTEPEYVVNPTFSNQYYGKEGTP